MTQKRNISKFDDYIEPRSPQLNIMNTCSSLNKSLSEFKLDKICPKNINMKLYQDSKQNLAKLDRNFAVRNKEYIKGSNCHESKFYHQYINLKEDHQKNKIRKSKISHIFNIRSINLLEKQRIQVEKTENDRNRLHQKHSSKDLRRNKTEKYEKEDLKGLNFMIINNTSQSPDNYKKKKCSYLNQKVVENHKHCSMVKNGDDKFENKLSQYYSFLKEHSEFHGIAIKQVETYGKNIINFYIGKGNNGSLIKQTLKKRWWWTICDDKTKKVSNFLWTQLKEKSFYSQSQMEKEKENSKRSFSSQSESYSKGSEGSSKNRDCSKQKQKAQTALQYGLGEIQVHNHFQNNQYLGNKKALYYNMKLFYEKQNKNVFDYLPVTFHVKRYNDETWQEFTKYYQEDINNHPGERRLWILKPGENSNRGNGIEVFSDYEKLKQWVQVYISGENNLKKTLIIQKYIDKPFLYNKRKFDIRCYMLLVRLNNSIKGYWYKDGYIRTSCFDYHVEDENAFVHLTNDAIQINCEKYGKYQDGNKLSFHNFQKYLDSIQKEKGSKNFVQDICPQLKKIATDSIQACYHLLGQWKGFPTFELFGLDFMIDDNFKPWLIEINTNPCLETASTTLERVIPRMVDSAFRLSLDILFPPPLTWQNSKKHYMPNKINNNNQFELIFDQSKKSNISGMISDEIIMEMGDIEEDNEIYDQPYEKKLKTQAGSDK